MNHVDISPIKLNCGRYLIDAYEQEIYIYNDRIAC